MQPFITVKDFDPSSWIDITAKVAQLGNSVHADFWQAALISHFSELDPVAFAQPVLFTNHWPNSIKIRRCFEIKLKTHKNTWNRAKDSTRWWFTVDIKQLWKNTNCLEHKIGFGKKLSPLVPLHLVLSSLVCVCLVPDHTPAGVRVFRKRSFSTCCATFRHFFYLLFRMAWVRIWMLFECFGSASPRALEAGDSSFLVRSVGDVSAVFRDAVSHGLGTYSLGINPAAVPLFRKRFSKSFLFRMVWASILLAFLRVP